MKIIPSSELDKLTKLVENDLKIRKELVKNDELTKFGFHPKMKKSMSLIYLI